MEQRKHRRYRFLCEIRFPGKEESVAGTVSDLSTGGRKVMSLASLYIGMYLALEICPLGQEATLKVDQAAVRWAREEEFGLEFITMWPEEEERLRRIVSTLETGPSH